MHLPDHLRKQIDAMLHGVSQKELEERYKRLSKRYRTQSAAGPHFCESQDFLAYLVARFPATYAGLIRVLEELKEEPKTILDLGAGPATGLLAALGHFETIERATLIEREATWEKLGNGLLQDATYQVQWLHQAPTNLTFCPCAYAEGGTRGMWSA